LYDGGINIEPYENVSHGIIRVRDYFYGRLNVIKPGESAVKCADMTSLITRKAFFVKIYPDEYEYLGWRFWGFWSESTKGDDSRMISGPGIGGPMNLFVSGKPYHIGVSPHEVFDYYFYDTVKVFNSGSVLQYQSDSADIISVRIDSDSILAVKAEYNGSKYVAQWNTPASGDPFNKLLLIEAPWEFQVDTVDFNEPVEVESTLVKYDDYVVFYKSN
jgi:hypothetical protein